MGHRTMVTTGLRPNARYLTDQTERDYRACAVALNRFFGKLRLDKITSGHLSAYQLQRATNPVDETNGIWHCLRGGRVHGSFETLAIAEEWARKHGGGCEFTRTAWAYRAGANRIRKEIALLLRLLRDARLWAKEDDERLVLVRREDPDVARAMSIEEQHRFLHVASERHEFRLVHQYAIVALQTTCSTNEMRALRLADIFLNEHHPFIEIPRAGVKCKGRKRTIPLLTDDALWAMEGLVARARELGAWSPLHYLFPKQKARTMYDPTQPMTASGLKKPWDAVRKAAGLPHLRIYDLRHTGITRMAEAGVPLPVAMSFAGHMTEQMQQHYTAICLTAQRGWGELVWGSNMAKVSPESAAQVREAFGGRRKPVAADKLAVSSQLSALSKSRRV